MRLMKVTEVNSEENLVQVEGVVVPTNIAVESEDAMIMEAGELKEAGGNQLQMVTTGSNSKDSMRSGGKAATENDQGGHYFTWCKKQEGDSRIYCKLDIIVVNQRWIDEWPGSEANFMNPGLSDHSPAVLEWNQNVEVVRPNIKFFNMWTEDDNFLAIVQAGWRKQDSETFTVALSLLLGCALVGPVSVFGLMFHFGFLSWAGEPFLEGGT
ncbi:hypothetical protein RIF29_19744 [Crotalaria pallida]|uniref:Uncharacterized protein n=1 Tax=Crotalaria pallida TaxID=3830 RepID=A0AAN9F2A9_CROPI